MKFKSKIFKLLRSIGSSQKSIVENNKQKIKVIKTSNLIRKNLKDFTQKETNRYKIDNKNHKFKLYENDYDENRLIRYLFKKILNFEVLDKPFEKVNWSIPFIYKSTEASISHEKFGFRLYISNEMSKKHAEELYKEIWDAINKSLKQIEVVIRQEGIQALERGEIILENKLHSIEKEFEYFLSESKKKKKKSNITKTVSLTSNKIKTNFDLYKQAEYLEDAVHIAFFSLLEHLCTLSIAFTNSPMKYEIKKFSRNKWRDKYKEVFPITDPIFLEYYNKFVDMAKYRRNPTAHGHLDNKYSIFYFYSPEAAHRIPMGLYDREIIRSYKTNESLDVYDNFLKFIRTNEATKRWMQYLDRGFDIFFEKSEFKEYETYLKMDEKTSKEYLDYLSRMEDDYANMDW